MFPLPAAGAIGVSLPIYNAKDRWKRTFDKKGVLLDESLVRELTIPYSAATWLNYVPAQQSVLTTHPWLTFKEVTCDQIQNDPLRAKLVLTYAQNDVPFDALTPGINLNANAQAGGGGGGGASGYKQLPESYAEENANTVSKSIRLHPKWSTLHWESNTKAMKDYWDKAEQRFLSSAPDGLPYVESFYDGSMTVTWHDFTWSKPSAPLSYVGRLSVPPGYPGSASNWIVVSGYRSRQAGYWRRSLVYLYQSQPQAVTTFLYDIAS